MPVKGVSYLKRSFHLFVTLLLSLVFSGCDIMGSGPCLEGSGIIVNQTRDVSIFTGVDVRVPGTVQITYGPNHTAQIETFADLQAEIKAVIMGSTLVIWSESCLDYANDKALIRITIPLLETVELRSAALVTIQQLNTQDKIMLNLSGSGSIDFNGIVNKLNLLHSGSGDIKLTGETTQLESILSGSGRIQGFALSADQAKIILTGSGYQQVWVKENLDATITGSGNIYYLGAPTISKYMPGKGSLINFQ